MLRAGVFAASSAGLVFIAMRIGLPGWVALAVALGGALIAAGVPTGDIPAPPGGRRGLALGLLWVGLAALWVLVLFHHGWALPPGDPIAVPQFARAIAQGSLLTQAYPPGSSGHAYPPGYPILFAPAAALLSPIDALAMFKAITLACVVLIPAAWAWLHTRLFPPQPPLWACAGLAYAAFFMAERTLGFVTPFAGKNALLVGLLVFPAVTLATLSLARSPRRWPLAVAPVYGLILIHYTMLHLLAAVLGAYFLVGLATRRRTWPEAARVLAVAVMSVGLLILLNHEATSDSRAGSLAFDPLDGLGELAELMLTQRPGFVIFMDQDFGLPWSPFRGLVLVICAAFAVLTGLVAKKLPLGESAAVYLIALLTSFAFALGVVPAGISLDFVRWFIWPLQSALFLCAGLGCVAFWSAFPGWPRALLAGLAAIAAGGGLMTLYADGRAERAVFRQTAVSHAELAGVDELLPDRAVAGGCFLIGESVAGAGAGAPVVVQRSLGWNYAETVSRCLYLNGSWVQPGSPFGREVDGLPSPAALRDIPAGAEVYFIGRPGSFEAYSRRMAREGLGWSWRLVGRAPPDAGVWRRALPPRTSAIR
jgi:hypothetical protein